MAHGPPFPGKPNAGPVVRRQARERHGNLPAHDVGDRRRYHLYGT